MIELPENLFRHKANVENIYHEQDTYTPIVGYYFKDGIYIWLEGAEYPQQGITTPEMMAEINQAKKVFAEALLLASKWWVAPTLLWFLIRPSVVLNDVVHYFVRLMDKGLRDFVLEYDFQTLFEREVEFLVSTLLKNLGVNNIDADLFGQYMATILGGDNAYRFRVRDIFDMTSQKKLLKQPIKEMWKIINEFHKRQWSDSNGRINIMFRAVGVVVVVGLLIPKFRRAFKKTIKRVKVSNLGYNEIDLYWVMFRSDYHFLGKTKEERDKMLGSASRPALKKWET